MNKLITLVLVLTTLMNLTSKAQNYYSFSKGTQAYVNLTGSTTLVTGAWVDFEKTLKLPFAFKLFNQPFIDSLYIDDWGSVSPDNSYNGEISFLGDDLNSRGANKSDISYKVEGTSPSRIFKLQYSNVSLDASGPLFNDSMHFQLWLYETSNIIEFRYGASAVNTSSWGGNGPFVGLIDFTNMTNFILLQGSTSNPTVNTTDLLNATELTGMPASGTIYRFTPSAFKTGINTPEIHMNVVNNQIVLPSDLVVTEIQLLNISGQLLQTATNPAQINLTTLPHGVYMVNITSEQGNFTKKIIL